MNIYRTIYSAAAAAGLLMATGVSARADAVADFYKEKTITLVVATNPGGGYDLYARTLATYIPNHIPGMPKILMQYIPGAGGIKAANHLYNIAPRDGSVIALLSQATALVQVLEGKGTRYNAAKFNAIGRIVSTNAVLMVRNGAPATSIEAMKKHQVAFATDGKGSQSQYNIVLMGKLLGPKIRVVPGYRGSARILHAMEQKEVDGYAISWASFKAGKANWITEKKVILLAEIGLTGSPDLKVPLLKDLATNSEDRKMLELVASPTAIGRSFIAPPDVPMDRIAALRGAFDATMKDPAFLAYTLKRKMVIEPMSGAEVQGIINDTVASPKALLAKINALVK
jgi:tripartite-type tricarboxylate transporter receptor subunit TctC